MSSRLQLLLLAAGILIGIAAEVAAFAWGQPHLWVPDLVVGWTFIGGGLLVVRRRPDTHSGLLMVATGFTWFAGNFATVAPGFVGPVAASATYLHRGPLVHLILGYPTGRLASATARVAVVFGYAAAVVPLVWDSEVATLVLAALVVVVAAREYGRAVGHTRRARLLALIAATGFAVAIAGGAVARLALPAGDVSPASLLAYQGILCAIAAGLAAGLTTAFWERVDIADLVVELGATPPRTLQAALAGALGDPSLEVGYWLPDAQSYVASDGRVLSFPDAASERSVTIVKRGGEPVAALVHNTAVLDDPALIEAVTAAAQLAASNARLRAEVNARVADVESSRRRVLEARDEQRRQLERRLHSGAQQRLEELRETLMTSRQSASGDQTTERILTAEAQLTRTIEDLRHLGRGLHPRVLTEQGLEAAVASLTDGFPVAVEISVTSAAIPPHVEAAAYYTCAEALANVAKHASASTARVSLTTNRSVVHVVVEDDGVGGASASGGSGLRGLADRIETLGGALRVESVVGGGTRIVAEIPLGDDTV